ncbi:MAG TPA: sortase [Candidatus Limnocylindrales bacterium]|jgi:sortase (surface protein transpeptidase)
MRSLVAAIRLRLVPAGLTAAGAMLVAAGLLSLGSIRAAPTGSPSSSASVEPSPSSTAASGSPAPSTTAAGQRVATRLAIPALDIDLPVVRPPNDSSAYPWCNVAMFLRELGQPGDGRATYLYAHARAGMFLPILEASQRNNGRRMVGMYVQVWTSDDQLFLYEIVQVRRHQTDLRDALAARREELWLQTSEGPPGTVPKTQVVARLLSSSSADHRDAHPRARPVDCS